MKNIGQRIALLREQRNLNQTQLATALGLSPQAVQAWESEKSEPKGNRIEEIAKILQCTSEYLLTGKGGYLAGDKGIYKIDALDVTASAGYGSLKLSETIEIVKTIEYEEDEAYKIFGSLNPNLKIISIKGDSMSRTLESGDFIFIDISIRKFDSDGIYVFTFGSGLFIKRLQFLKDRIVVLSDNKAYEKWDITESEQDQLLIHGKVMLSQSVELRKHG